MPTAKRLLIAGDVLGNFGVLWRRAKALNESKAGPFDLILVAGQFFADDSAASAEEVRTNLASAPLPTYFTDARGVPGGLVLGEGLSGKVDGGDAGGSGGDDAALDASGLPPPVHYLGPGGMTMIGTLTVAYLSPGAKEAEGLAALEELCGKSIFLGADVLLTPEWPAGLSTALPQNSGQSEALEALGVHIDGVGQPSAAKAAVQCRPRYHFSGTEGAFFQRTPYRNFEAPPTRKQSFITRFVGLGAIVAGGGKVDKARKWLHAVAVDPIPYMTQSALLEEPVGTTDSPFSLRSSQNEQAQQLVATGGFAPPGAAVSQSMGIAASFQAMASSSDAQRSDNGLFFFGAGNNGRSGAAAGQKRRRRDHDNDDVDESNCTLFVGGLGSGGVDSGVLQTSLAQAIPGLANILKQVRVPPGKPYAFLEFADHQAAKEALYALDGMPIIIGSAGSVSLSVGWGKGKQHPQAQPGFPSGPRPPLPPGPPPAQRGVGGLGDRTTLLPSAAAMREAEQASYALDETNCTLFIGGIGTFASVETAEGAADSALKVALIAAVPAFRDVLLGVRVPPGKTFGFAEFSSHSAAQHALASLAAVDHLPLPPAPPPSPTAAAAAASASSERPPPRLQVRWAKPKSESERSAPSSKRVRYEPDSRVDCWFCLASPTCEAHLVVSLATEFYMALPKGGLSDTHVLLIPIAHCGSQAALSDVARRDLVNYKQALAAMHFETMQGSGMVCFERFADTKGTYHQHQQVRP
jgi:hypothetical protein